ncbi:hypothetical protein ACI65C_013679 [Semiaphis heraclei]
MNLNILNKKRIHNDANERNEDGTNLINLENKKCIPWYGFDKYFKYVDETDENIKVLCLLCLPSRNTKSTSKKSSTNLKRHMKKVHVYKYTEFLADTDVENKMKCLQNFQNDEDTVTKSLSMDDKPSNLIQSTLHRIGTGNEIITQKQLDSAIIKFVVQDTQPINIVDKPVFLNLIRLGLPKTLTVMCSKTLKTRLNSAANKMKVKFDHIWMEKELVIAACLIPRFKLHWLEGNDKLNAELFLKNEFTCFECEISDEPSNSDSDSNKDFFCLSTKSYSDKIVTSDQELLNFLNNKNIDLKSLFAFPKKEMKKKNETLKNDLIDTVAENDLLKRKITTLEAESEKMITLQQMDKLLETKFAKFENRIVKSLTNSIDDNSGKIKEVKLNVTEKHDAVLPSSMFPSSSAVLSLPAKSAQSVYDEFADLQIKQPTSYEDETIIRRAKSRFTYWSKGGTARCCTLDRKRQTSPKPYVLPSCWPTVMPSDMDKLSNSLSKLISMS